MDPDGSQWILMNPMDSDESGWFKMDPYGSFWIPMEPYGSQWILWILMDPK